MADPVDFEGANFTFLAPEDLPNCRDLHTLNNRTGEIVSCWQLSEEELKIVNETGVVWLTVLGQGMPPVRISGDHAVFMADGRPARPETNVPKRKNDG